MNKENLLLLLLAVLLLAAMLYTLLSGGHRSKHGYGLFPSTEGLQPIVVTANL